MTEYAPVLVDAPNVLPVSVEECKQHLRVTGNDEDGLIAIFLDAAVAHLDGAEGWLGRSIVAQTWSQQFDAFQRTMRLDVAPISEVNVVNYVDGDGVSQTVSSDQYVLINGGSAPELRFDPDFNFPVISEDRPAITITFASGYGDSETVPAAIKVGIMLLVGDMYQNREAKTESGMIENSIVRMLLDPYRTRWVA